MSNLREVLNGPMHTGRWTQYWRRRRDGKIRRAMKPFWLIICLIALVAIFVIGLLIAAMIAGM